MTLQAKTLARGEDWLASEIVCRAGPQDKPFEEQHAQFCLAMVLSGTFEYRSSRGAATMAPGAVLLGNPGDCFECGHRHSSGDRCIAFHLDPALFEEVQSVAPGLKRSALTEPALPPSNERIHLLVAAEAAKDDCGALEELALELAAIAAADPSQPNCLPPATPARRGRIEEMAQWLEAEFTRPLGLVELARRAGMRRYHLIREFKRVVGSTPYQFILALRLRHAARLLRDGTDSILSVALDSGFSDQSEFNRRFQRLTGLRPAEFRKGARPRRPLVGAD